jgi:regulator of sirC expression with transglutaminase-like and TPR domain
MDAVRTALETLEKIGSLPDAAIDLGESALALAALDYPEVDYARYRAHLAALAREVGARDAAPAEALRGVLIGAYGYQGDRESYDDLDNANLIRVIDRRRGLPVSLSILWLHAARAQGWRADGLNFPGHFLIRVAAGERGAVIDPFNGGVVLGEAELVALRRRGGGNAALGAEDCAPVGNRMILLRLQNNIKLRLLEAKRTEAAVTVLERMVLTAPQEPSLWHECAGLHESLGNLRTAASCFERVIALAGGGTARQAAAAALAKLRLRLN